jgi:hypothetical protein
VFEVNCISRTLLNFLNKPLELSVAVSGGWSRLVRPA